MKIYLKYIIYITLLIIGIAGWIFYTNPSWSPWFCSRHSGKHSYAWGPPVEECERVGCNIQKIKEYDLPNTFDASGYEFNCVKP